MQFNEVTLNDKALFNSYLQGRKRNLITYCFSSFYLWREWDPYSWAIVEDALVVKSNYKNLDTICVPISADDQAVLRATEAMIEAYQQENKEFIISEVSADDLLFYEKYWPGRFLSLIHILFCCQCTCQLFIYYSMLYVYADVLSRSFLGQY